MRIVRFIGGPYDGHYQDAPPAGPHPRLAIKVNLDVFAALQGRPSSGDAPTTSVAVYHFDPSSDAYLFVRPLAPCQAE